MWTQMCALYPQAYNHATGERVYSSRAHAVYDESLRTLCADSPRPTDEKEQTRGALRAPPDFRKYPEIENTFREKRIAAIRAHCPEAADGRWVVQEKVHGANIRIYVTATETLVGSRKTVVSNGAAYLSNVFHRSQHLVYTVYYGCFRNLYEAIRADRTYSSDMSQRDAVTVYGEIYGGAYPHEAVVGDPAAAPVQRGGPYYSPYVDLYMFDVAVGGRFLPVAAANRLFEENALPYAKTLFKGSFDECLAFPCTFPTTLSGYLPPLPDNLCEGIVLRPEEPAFLPSGSRVILKKVNAKFRETIGARPPAQRRTKPLSEPVAALSAALQTYVTAARLDHVLSHRGTSKLAPSDFGELIGALNRDAIADFRKDYGAAFDVLARKDQTRVTKSINGMASALVNKAIRDASE